MDYRQFVLFMVIAYQFDFVDCFKAVGKEAKLSAKVEVNDDRKTKKIKKWNARKFSNARFIPDPEKNEWLRDYHIEDNLTESKCMGACYRYTQEESNPNKECNAFNFCKKGNDCELTDGVKVGKNYSRCILLTVGLEEGKEYENYDAVENPNWVHYNSFVEVQ